MFTPNSGTRTPSGFKPVVQAGIKYKPPQLLPQKEEVDSEYFHNDCESTVVDSQCSSRCSTPTSSYFGSEESDEKDEIPNTVPINSVPLNEFQLNSKKLTQLKKVTEEIYQKIDALQNKIDRVSYNSQTKVFGKDKERKKISQYISELEGLIVRFDQKITELTPFTIENRRLFYKNIYLIETFNDVFSKVCNLNDAIYLKMASPNINLKYKIIDIPGIIKHKNNLTLFLTSNNNIDIRMQHIRNLRLQFARGEIRDKQMPLIALKMNETISEFINFKTDCRFSGINRMFKDILSINKFLMEKDIAIDVTPLMEPGIIQKFNLKKKISPILQSDMVHYYFVEAQREVSKGSKTKDISADFFTELSQNYATRIFNMESDKRNLGIKKDFFVHCVTLSIYATTYYNIVEEDDREKVVKDIFGNYPFLLPKSLMHTKYESYYVLKTRPIFIINIMQFLHKMLRQSESFIHPLEKWTEDQLRSLLAYLDEVYEKLESYPECLREWVKMRMDEMKMDEKL